MDGTVHGQMPEVAKDLEMAKHLEVERILKDRKFLIPTPFPGAPATESALEQLREPFPTPPPPGAPTQRPAMPGRSDASLHWMVLEADRPASTPYSHTVGCDFGTVRPQASGVLPQTGMQSVGVQESANPCAPARAFVVRGAEPHIPLQRKTLNQTVQERQTISSGVLGTGHVTSILQDVHVKADDHTTVLQGPGSEVPTGLSDSLQPPQEAEAPADDAEASLFDILWEYLRPKDI
eukprot:jgi/Botrbrau1/1354/Bobra.0063s0065.1